MDTEQKLVGKTITSAEIFRNSGTVKLTFTDGYQFVVSVDKSNAVLESPPLEVVQYRTTNNNEYKLILLLLTKIGYFVEKILFDELSKYSYIVVYLPNKKVGGNTKYLNFYKNHVLVDNLDEFLKLCGHKLDDESKTV